MGTVKLMWHRVVLWVGVFSLGLFSAAFAAPLNLTLLQKPDIFSGFINVTYNATTKDFIASGFALQLRYDNAGNTVTSNIVNGTFNLTAKIDNAGNAVSGSLTISGNVLGFNSPLLTGNITAFGFVPTAGGQPFEFLLTSTGGALATPTLFGNPGSAFGVILSQSSSTFAGNFMTNFSDAGANAVSDTALIPEPSTVSLVLLAVFTCAGILRRDPRRL